MRISPCARCAACAWASWDSATTGTAASPTRTGPRPAAATAETIVATLRTRARQVIPRLPRALGLRVHAASDGAPPAPRARDARSGRRPRALSSRRTCRRGSRSAAPAPSPTGSATRSCRWAATCARPSVDGSLVPARGVVLEAHAVHGLRLHPFGLDEAGCMRGSTMRAAARCWPGSRGCRSRLDDEEFLARLERCRIAYEAHALIDGAPERGAGQPARAAGRG